MSLATLEKRYLARDDESEGIEIARARGSYVYDSRGKKYVDFTSGWCVGNLGWSHPTLRAAARRFKGPDYVFPGYSYKGWVELARLLEQMAPGELTKCYRATGGSEAVDIALQAAIVHTGRHRFVSLEDSYHGNTLGPLSVGTSENGTKVLPCSHIKPPLDAGALDRVETQLKRRDVAGFIMEPIAINLGVLSPEPEFMTGLQRLCRRYGTVLIMDEVACGFGRTGRVFATEHYDIEPDVMCLGKAITGGSAPMAAVISTEEVAESMVEEGTFYSTYGWHPQATEVAIANVRYIMRNERRLLDDVTDTSAYIRDRLIEMDFREEPELRIRGLAIGVDVGDEEYATEIEDECRRGGLLVTADESMLMLLPALTIGRPAAKRGMDILAASV